MRNITLIATCLIFFVGCAAKQLPVPLGTDFFQKKETIGIYLDSIPEGDTHIAGANCLLCYGVAAAANSSLSKHMKTVDTNELSSIDDNLKTVLDNKGLNTKLITNEININELKKFPSQPDHAKKDFRSLKKKLGVDKLLVIDLGAVGAYRTYAEYVPTSNPMGSIAGIFYIVNLDTNAYEFYDVIDHKVPVKGNWDEPPKFPGVTTALFEAIEKAKDQTTAAFN